MIQKTIFKLSLLWLNGLQQRDVPDASRPARGADLPALPRQNRLLTRLAQGDLAEPDRQILRTVAKEPAESVPPARGQTFSSSGRP
jgi:hypothetical protein